MLRLVYNGTNRQDWDNEIYKKFISDDIYIYSYPEPVIMKSSENENIPDANHPPTITSSVVYAAFNFVGRESYLPESKSEDYDVYIH